MEKKIPAYIITGFLGSGKTTVLQSILNYCEQHRLRPAIVLNEIGETNVEGDLFSNEAILEMLNGCICCSIQEDFTKDLTTFLQSLSRNEKPDILLIEGTGIADPLEIVDALTDPVLIELVDLFSVISLIDASKYLEYQSIFSSSKEVRAVLKSQINNSSFIILNKVDLINKRNIEKVRKKVEEQKRNDTPVVETSFGKIDINQLIKRRILVSRSSSSFSEEKSQKCGCGDNYTCTDHKHTHNHSFQAIKIDLVGPIDRVKFEKWLKGLPKTMVRGKGIIQLTESLGGFQFQYSSNEFKLIRLNKPTPGNTCVILIGTDLVAEAIEKSFNETFNV